SPMALLFLVGTMTGISFTDEKTDGGIVAEAGTVEPGSGKRAHPGLDLPAGPLEMVRYSSYSAFTPLSTVRSLLSAHDRKVVEYESDSSLVARQAAQAVP
ncbi:MAG: hypothetical protein WD275_03795, partial [Rhodothermales bacterium]